MEGREEGGWDVCSSVLGELDDPVSITSLIRQVRKEPCDNQCLVSSGPDDVRLKEREGQVRRAEHLISTSSHLRFMSGRHL